MSRFTPIINIPCTKGQFIALFDGALDDVPFDIIEGAGMRKLKLDWSDELCADIKKLVDDCN